MNTPRQPNARPGRQPFLGQTRNADPQSCPSSSSFVVSFGPGSTRPPVETPDNVAGKGSTNAVT